MEAAPANGAEVNFDTGTILGVSPIGTIIATSSLNDEADRFASGKIYIAGIGRFNVETNAKKTTSDYNWDEVLVGSSVPASAVGKEFYIYDDDYYKVEGNGPRRMPYSLSGGSLIYTAFADAFIEPTKLTQLQYIQTDVTYKRNLDSTGVFALSWANFVSSRKNAPLSEDFWSVYLLAAWQPRIIDDRDPTGSGGTLGTSYDIYLLTGARNFGAIYVEPTREMEIYTQLNEPRTQEYHAVVHEIGHQSGEDHYPDDQYGSGGLMTEGAPHKFLNQSLGRNDKFRPPAIKRFRRNPIY